jgi:hypothetical protein
MQKYFIIPLVIAIVAVFGWYFLQAHPAVAPTSNEPAPHVAYTNASENDIVVSSPKPGSTFGQVVAVNGQARGSWYFEASFPIVIEDAGGNIIGQGIGSAEGDWMTEEFVPFKAIIGLSKAYSGPATVVFKKDNPSGEPARDASVSVPIVIQ